MKTMKEIIKVIKNLKEETEQKYRAEIVGIFGSFARGEQRVLTKLGGE